MPNSKLREHQCNISRIAQFIIIHIVFIGTIKANSFKNEGGMSVTNEGKCKRRNYMK